MAVNKVVYDGRTIIDISDSTVTPETLKEGVTAYSKDGEKITGTNTDAVLLTQLLTRTNAEHMFGYCTQLKTIPQIDTSMMTDMNGMFYECKLITTIPEFDTSNVVNMRYLCRGCDNLITIPELDTRKVTSMHQAFFYCRSLTTIPKLDVRNVTDLAHVVNGCKSLQTCLFRNIKTALTVGSGNSYGHLLTVENLIHLIYELRDTGANKTLTVGTTNLEKLANVYVRLVEITDKMRAEDDLIDEKLPFEVCESTDEGATLIKDYVALKKWAIA